MGIYEGITLSEEGNSRIEIKQSVFIGHSIRVNSREEAEAFVRTERDLYPDARHSCYAWRVTGEAGMQKYSDDGEPQGTAGFPMLTILDKNEINNCVVVVTRYFGGILLGKGGLVRAYTDSAKEAVINAQPIVIEKGMSFGIDIDYSSSDKVFYELRAKGWGVENITYLDKVSADVVIKKGQEEELEALMARLSSGRITPVKKGEMELIGERIVLQ